MIMTLLHVTTFICVALALLLIAALVVARHVKRRADHQRAPRRRSAATALLLWSERDGDERMKTLLAGLDPDLLLDVLGDVVPVATEAQQASLFGALRQLDHEEAIRRRMRTADVGQRMFLTELLASMGGGTAKRLLAERLDDGACDVRVAAAIGLAQLSALPPLGKVLSKLGPQGRRSARLVQLFEIAVPFQADAIRSLVTANNVEPRVRVSAMQALVRLWDPASVMLLEKTADDEAVAVAAAREVHWLPPIQGAAMLRRLMDSPSTQVRRAAASAADDFGDLKLLAPLERLAQDEDALVRHLAARSVRHVEAAMRIPASTVRPAPAFADARSDA